jgi:hypothetical protein
MISANVLYRGNGKLIDNSDNSFPFAAKTETLRLQHGILAFRAKTQAGFCYFRDALSFMAFCFHMLSKAVLDIGAGDVFNR